jgi:hypothetical protein
MANLPTRFVLFLSSYVPLWIIFGIVSICPHPYIGWAFFFLAAVSAIVTMLFLREVKALQGLNVTLTKIHRRDSETMSYIASYIIPFAATSLDKIEQVLSLLVFFSVLCLVYVNSAMIHINPLLTIIGYRLYEIEDSNGDTIFLISERRLHRGDTVSAVDIAEGIFLEKTP